MGRGDKKTFKGKLFRHSHGKVRPGRPAKKTGEPESKVVRRK